MGIPALITASDPVAIGDFRNGIMGIDCLCDCCLDAGFGRRLDGERRSECFGRGSLTVLCAAYARSLRFV